MSKTIDGINVRLHVALSFSVTLGIYDGPITREAIAEHVAGLLEAGGGPRDFIDAVSIEEISDDDGTSYIANQSMLQLFPSAV